MEHNCYNLIDNGVKKCYCCQIVKPLTDFCKDKRGIGGFKNSCKFCQKIRRKEHYIRNKEKENLSSKSWKKKNPDRCKLMDVEWRKKNPEKVKVRKRKYYLQDKSIPKKRVEMVISGAIRKRIVYHRSMGRFENILGYTTEQLVSHLESKFKPEMTWDNYGSYWHIDHIKPKSWFKYTTIDDPGFKECWSLSNLQPLEAGVNMSKQNRYEG